MHRSAHVLCTLKVCTMILAVIVVVLYVCVYFYYRLDERLTSIVRLCAQECTCIVYIEGVCSDFGNNCYCIVYRLDKRLTSIARLCARKCTCIVYTLKVCIVVLTIIVIGVYFCYRLDEGFIYCCRLD